MPEFSEVLEIDECFAKAESEKAILVQLPDLDEAWIPKGQIDDDSEVYRDGTEGTLVISEWLGRKKGLTSYGRVKLRDL